MSDRLYPRQAPSVRHRQTIVDQVLKWGMCKDLVAMINNVTVRSVDRYLARMRDNDTVLSDAERLGRKGGRPRVVLSRVDIWVIERLILENTSIFIREIQIHLQRLTGTIVSNEILRLTLKTLGYRKKVVWKVCIY